MTKDTIINCMCCPLWLLVACPLHSMEILACLDDSFVQLLSYWAFREDKIYSQLYLAWHDIFPWSYEKTADISQIKLEPRKYRRLDRLQASNHNRMELTVTSISLSSTYPQRKRSYTTFKLCQQSCTMFYLVSNTMNSTYTLLQH